MNVIFDNYTSKKDEIEYENMKELFDNFFDFQNSTFLLMGIIQLWHGSYSGGFTFNCFTEMQKAWNNCEYFKIYDEKGHLYIECSHHDGTNNFEIKKLTSKGEAYLENNRYQTPKEIHYKLWESSNYSRLPRFYEFTFGKKFC